MPTAHRHNGADADAELAALLEEVHETTAEAETGLRKEG
jgi:hypothetical protein